MDKVCADIFKEAMPYLDTRENEVHVQIAFDFAKRLLALYPEARGDIVLPAIILHDVGWKMVPEEEQLESFGPKMKDKTKQRRHEIEGVGIAREILLSLDFNERGMEEVLSIIDGHDSRKEAINLHDQLVKDADKLWRFTQTGVEIDYKRFGIERNEQLEFLSDFADEWFFTPEAKDMAREALNQAKSHDGL